MKRSTIERSEISFSGILRTSRGSVILVAVENMPISPESPSGFPANRAYEYPIEPQERGAGVGQRIYIGQQYDAATQLDYLGARYYDSSRGQFLSEDPQLVRPNLRITYPRHIFRRDLLSRAMEVQGRRILEDR